jgi:hypothetical protein
VHKGCPVTEGCKVNKAYPENRVWLGYQVSRVNRDLQGRRATRVSRGWWDYRVNKD